MIKFLQLELTATPNIPTIIGQGNGVPFNLNQYPGSGGTTLVHDIITAPDTIHINQAGTYFATWFVSTQTGLSPAGSSWELTITTNDSSDYPRLSGSGHVKIAPASGSAVISLNADQVPAVLKLRNISGHNSTLSSRNTCLSSLAIFEIDVEKPPAPTFSPAYFQAQIHTRTEPTDFVVEPETRIPFDVMKKNRNITLDVTTDTGKITVNTRGTYSIFWEIPIETTETAHDATLVLTVNGVEDTRSYLPYPVGVLSGSAILEIATPYTTIELLNKTDCAIRVTDVANVTIFQIDE